MKLFYLIFLLGFISSASFAWMCPTTFNQISPGDTIDQVIRQCGEPTSKDTVEKFPSVPQKWEYYVAVSQPYQATYTPSPSSNSPNFATIKMSVTFVNDKVINITVQDQSLANSTLCGLAINTGDSTKRVEQACGKPVFIQKQDNPNAKPNLITQFKYNAGAPNILIFENGRLKNRK